MDAIEQETLRLCYEVKEKLDELVKLFEDRRGELDKKVNKSYDYKELSV